MTTLEGIDLILRDAPLSIRLRCRLFADAALSATGGSGPIVSVPVDELAGEFACHRRSVLRAAEAVGDRSVPVAVKVDGDRLVAWLTG